MVPNNGRIFGCCNLNHTVSSPRNRWCEKNMARFVLSARLMNKYLHLLGKVFIVLQVHPECLDCDLVIISIYPKRKDSGVHQSILL